MEAHSSASGQGFSAVFSRNSLVYKLISVLVAWAMIMSSMPLYGSDQAHARRLQLRDFASNPRGPVPAATPAGHRSPRAKQVSLPPRSIRESLPVRTAVAQPRSGNIEIASLHAPAFLGNNVHGSLLNGFASGLFALPVQAADSPLQLSLAFADNSSASANFPEPWNDGNPLVNFVGGGVIYRAGAVRLDNPGTAALTVDSVTVDLGRPGPVFQLWQNVTIPAGGSAILTQTQDGNFNTSASPLVGCGVALDPNETRIPKIIVTIAGTSTGYLDTAHVLDTGGFDSSCRGNQSLEWRPLGTAGIESPSGSLQLIADGAPHAVGTQDTVTVVVNDAASHPLANVPVNLTVVNGPNAGKSFSGTSDASGSTTIQYSSSAQGTDLIQAVVKNASTGVLQSQQTSTTWTSADICPSPSAPNAAATRLIYVGQTSVTFGSNMRVSALLTDGTGNPLAGRTLSFTVAGQNATATTAANGIATLLESSLPAGQSGVAVSFAGDQSFQAAQLTTTVTVLPAPTLLRYTGSNLITAQGQQTVSAVLTDGLGRTAIAGRTLTFTLNGIGASAVTDANGSATATLNLATALPTGAGQLQINFAGDADYQPSSRAVPVQIYQPMPFVIWGGNSGGLLIGQRVNFWGSQWESQVINGLYFGANPSFKGWAGAVASFVPCEAGATLATLDMSCWQVKPGQSFPPDEVLPAYIEVVVSTAINKSGDTVFGNIACGAILQVDHTPPYGAVPGQDGFGTIAAVNGDCSGVFPKPAVIVGSQQQKSLVLPGEKVSVGYNVANQGATDATGVVLNENFDQVTPATGTANLGTIAAGTSASGSFPVTVPAVSPRQASETTVDYSSRLAAQDGRLFTSQGEITFTDPFSQLYTPVDIASFSQLTLPRLTAGLSGPTCIAPNTTLPYQVTLENVGSNTATQIAATLTLPDSTTATPPVPDLAAGTRFVGTVNWSAPGIAPKAANETTDAYLNRLHASDGITLPAAVLSALWQDALANAYGPVEQPFVTLTQRIPVVSTSTPATQALLPNQKTQLSFGVSNTGTGNAVQVTLQLKRPDGTFSTVPNFSLPGGQSATVTANYQAPTLAPKGAAESDADYTSRLQALNNTSLNLDASLSWTDPAQNVYGPTDNPFIATEQAPIVNITLAAPANANSGDTITYAITLTNAGKAQATVSTLSITLPDGSVQHPAPSSGTIAPGATASANVNFAIDPNHPNGTVSATAMVAWSDSVQNLYGPLSASASTQVTLPNLPPVVFAGTNQTVPFPNNFPLQGSVTDDGKPAGGQLTSTWTQVSGPSAAVFADPHNPQTTVTLNAEGSYVLKLTGDDSQLQSSAEVTITTIRANKAPVVTVGPDQTIELPTNALSLTGNATDDGLPAGSSLTYSWTQIAGPGTATFGTATAPNTTAAFSAVGVYLLRLTASDSQLNGSADVRVTVLPHNNPPTVAAGPSQTIFQPTNTVSLQGTITDDGLPAGGTITASWSVVSGPGIVKFANPASATTTATFSTLGVYTLRLTGSDSELTAQADTTVTVKPANLPPLVNAGPPQTVILPSNVASLPLAPALVAISTGFNNPIAVDYHQTTNKLVMSVNYSNGLPHNFELVAPDGSRQQFSNISGLTDEVYIATARDEGNGRSIGGFNAGEMFTGSGVAGVIVRTSADGKTVQNPWVRLPNETGLLRGQLYIDRTGIFGGDLIVATTAGNIWRVNSAGIPTRLANVGVPPEGLLTIPADPQHYGPWAGKIITGSENLQRIFAIDPQGNMTYFDLGIAPENIKPVNANENFFGVDFSSRVLWGIPAAELSGMVGDVLVGEESPGNLWQVHWNGSTFEKTRIAQVAQWEGATVAPAGIAQVASTTASVTLNGTVSDDGLPVGGTLTSVWTKVSGPGLATFTSPSTPSTVASFSQPGVYVLRLTASDSELTSSSDVTINISANQAPVVNAGNEQQATFPATVTLNGSATDDGLPKGQLNTFWTKVSGPGTVTFTSPSFVAGNGFSATSNPSGVWTYGSTPTRGGTFTSYAFTGQVSGMPAWFRTAPSPSITFPLLAFNNTGAPVGQIPPNTFLLHPGAAGENSVLRWTAPNAGTFLVQGRFAGADNTTTDVSVLLNSSTTLLSGNINGLASGVPFSFVKALNAGDVLDFSVGYGNGNNGSDSTSLTVTITQAGASSTTASFSTAGDYVLRLTGYDSEAFSFSDVHVRMLTSCVTPPNGLVGWWPGDGDARDLASSNTGVIEDGVTFVPGMVGNAFSFNGGSADVVVPAATVLNVNSLTFDAWIFPLDIGPQRPIIEYSSTNGTIGPHLWTNLNSSVQVSNGALYANIIDTAGAGHIISTGGGALQWKQWNHVALTYDQTTGIGRLYVNGAPLVSSNLGIFTPRTTLPLYIGARPNSTHFLGHIDEVEVFNRALSPAEILSIFTAGNAGKCKPTGPQPPVVSAGLDQTITLPLAQVALNGTATDPNGGQLSIAWSQVSGPGAVSFGNPASPATTATFSGGGIYVLRLTATNAQSTASSEVTINVVAPLNQAPKVDPGPDQTVQLPTTSVTLNGKVTDDGLPLGSSVTQQWSKFSGPGSVTFSAATQPVTQATFSSAGTYSLQLTATDSQLSTAALVTVTVLPAPTPNQAPAISVTADNVNLTLPANTVSLTGTITDDGQPAGSTVTAQWSQVSGPAPVSFSNPASPSTKAVFSVAGSYVLKLTASDSQLTNSVNIPVTVNPPAPNQAPSVTVIASQNAIALPSNVISLTGNVTDDGLPVGGTLSFQWSVASGPAPVTFSNPAGGSTQAAFAVAGTYVLQLAVSDSQLTGTGAVSIIVNPAGTNQAPTVSIVADQTAITLPANSVTLTGTITDDGLPSGTVSSQWSQVSGPGAAIITQLTSTSVKVTFPAAGVYIIKLSASDGQLSSSAAISITVTTAGGNQPPSVSAGPNQTIQLPQNTVALQGDARDDGLPAGSTLSVSWSEISGPAAVSFSDPNSLLTQVTFSAAGTYILQLLASDTQLQSTSQVTIIVNPSSAPPPPPPVVSFSGFANGAEITSPTPIVGSVSSGAWKLEYSLLDGAGNPTTFVTFASGTTAVTNGTLGTFDPTVLLNGQYLVRFSSTDNAGQTASVTSTVDVSRNNKVGNFTFSVVDLSLPAPGLPITLTRTYDSRNKQTGDFGVGWTMNIANVRVQKTGGPIGQTWDEEANWAGFFPTYCLQPLKKHTVTITFSDGKVYKFQPVSSPQCQLIVPITNPQFTFTQIPTGGATAGATLTPVGDTDFIIDGAVPGTVNILDAELNFADYTQFQLTTVEGFTYDIDQQHGVTSVTDRNGNTLTINSSGIQNSSGRNVAFVRDGQGRITRITDAAGNSLIYSYDSSGNLASSVDQIGNTTSYGYDADHLLLTVVNPNGVQALRNEYDSSGRLISQSDALGNTNTFTHDVDGHHETIADRLGNVTQYVYDDAGNVVTLTDALGQTTNYTYDADGNKLTETNPLGQTMTFAYDSLDNKTSETDALGRTTRSTYNSFGQLLTTTDGLGRTTTNTYDAQGRQLSSQDPDGNVTHYAYASDGQLSSKTDAQNNVTSYAHDSNGNLIKQTDALGNATSYTYDGNGNRLTQSVTRTKSDGTSETLTTSYQYDGVNRLIKTTYPDNSSDQVAYNALDLVSDKTDALGRTTHYDYDENAQLTKTTYPDGTTESSSYDAAGRQVSFTDRAGHVTTFSYDAVGRLVKKTFADGSSMSTTYDAAGRPASTTDPNGNTTLNGYDAAGQLISTTDALGNVVVTSYDAAGNKAAITDANGNTTHFVYNGNNRLIKTIYPDATFTSSTYDTVLRKTAETDQAGKSIHFSYDSLGRLISVTNPLGQITSYTYDELGHRVTQTDANNHTTTFAYDQRGNRIQTTLPLGQREARVYDPAGNLISRIDGNGQTTTYTYDAMNRLLEKTADPFFAQAGLSAAFVRFSYSPTGQRASMTDASGTTAYTYDQRDRLVTKATPVGTLNYSYDAAGNIVSISSSHVNGTSTTYAYDPLNRLKSVTASAGATSYSYDPAGNMVNVAYPNLVNQHYSYNSLNRLTAMNVTSAGSAGGQGGGGSGPLTIGSYAYALGAAGNRLSVAELSGRAIAYGYDDLYRLTSETISGSPTQNGTLTYQYDAVGNRLRLNSTLPAIPPTGLLSYDANDRLGTEIYDANGNNTFNGQSNVYDFEDRLVQRGGISIVYDGDGNRVAETVAGITTNYLTDTLNPTGLPQVLEELQNGSVTRRYTYGSQLISQAQTLDTVWTESFYGYDGHGSVRQLTDATGAVTDTYDYDAFGNLISQTGSTPNLYLFAGQQFDPALGVYFNRARYLDVRTGRFWTTDPFDGCICDPLSLHRYLYAAANPVNKIDPSGNETEEELAVSMDISETLDSAVGQAEQALGKRAIRTTVCTLGSALIDQGIQEGVYLFLSEVAPGIILPYVGQTGDIAARIAQHVRDDKMFETVFHFIEVEGGTEARRVAEQKVINALADGFLQPGIRGLAPEDRVIANLRNEIRPDKFAKICQ